MTDVSLSEVVLCERTDGWATVVLNRPEARNAINRAIRLRLATVLGELDADETVGCIVVTGQGSAFCAGVDLRELTTADPSPMPVDPVTTIRALQTPNVAAVNGACVTGGLEMALACDFVIASDNAFFVDTHASLGFVATWGLYERLAEAVGIRQAKEMCLTGRRVGAAEAARMGLVNRVVPSAELMPDCASIASTISRVAPAVRTAVRQRIDALRRDESQ